MIAIECLRVFEPNVYSKLSNSKEAFTTLRSVSGNNQTDKVKYSRIIEDIIKSASEKIENLSKVSWKTFFLLLSGSLATITMIIHLIKNGLRNSECHKDHFDKYFKLSFDSEDFSTSDFINFLKLTANREQLKDKILALDARNVLEDFYLNLKHIVNKF